MKIKNENGVTLVTVIIMIVVMSIIASVSIVGGVKVLREAKAQVKESNLAAVKAVVNREAAKAATAGVFTPASYNHYGTPAFGIVSGDADILNGWYLVDEEDLKEMGVDYIGENYLVSYKANRVVALNDYLLSGNLDAENALTSEKSNSVVTLAKNGTLKVGDYIDYKPSAVATYTTNPNNTGNAAQTFTADTGANWRILSTNQSTGEVMITTEGAVNNNFALSGIKAYMNGKTELNNVCKSLYSNNEMGLVARSMTVEDVNRACGINVPEDFESYYGYNDGFAYYIDGDTWLADDTIQYNGKAYYKKLCREENVRFYESDGGGVSAIDENGFSYRYPTTNNPVYATNRYYEYPIESTVISSVIGNNIGWLASPYTELTDQYYGQMRNTKTLLCYNGSNIMFRKPSFELMSYNPTYSAYFGIYALRNDYVGGFPLRSVEGEDKDMIMGIRPVVVLGSSSLINVDDTSRDGSSAEKAWSLIK